MPSSLFALLDDIATILDDVALLTKVAAKKTTGVIGDDLALNAQQVSGISAERELPVVWAVAKGSARNKLILVPAAIAISAITPWAVIPLLMLGGVFLCFEGVEKLAHKWLHGAEDEAHEKELIEALSDPAVDLAVVERDKIKGAIRTDFILSAEIVTIALGTVAGAAFLTRVVVLTGIAAVMTVGVYGLVAGIVKLDDLGLHLTKRADHFSRVLGAGILRVAPYLMKALSIAGTVAMFMVGGGILTHGIPPLDHLIHDAGTAVSGIPVAGGFLAWLLPSVLNAVVGLVAGAVALVLVTAVQKLLPKKKAKP
jgi:uncharacterized protein